MLRPSVRPALLMSAALLLAAACGSDDPADSSSSSDAGSASVTAESDDQASGGDSADTTVAGTSEEEETDMTDADTVTETETETVDDEDAVETQLFVDDLGREVEIPADPQRVIFVGVEHAAHVTTLGFEPLAVASSYLGDAGAALEGIGGVPVDLGGMVDVGDGEPNFEAIAAAEPDLLVWWTDEDVVATLSEIAPTIAIDARANGTNFIDDNDGPRWSKQRSLAELFGLEERLDEQIVEYEDLVADIRARHGGLTESLEWALCDTWEGQAYMYNTPTYAYNAALPDIGLTPTASHERATAEGGGYDESIGYAVIAAELVPDYDADLIFVSRPEPDAAIDTVLEATAAGASDQVYPVDVARWTFHVLQAEISVLREVDAILSAGDVEALGQLDEAGGIDDDGVGHAPVAVDAVECLRARPTQRGAPREAGLAAQAVHEGLHRDRAPVDVPGELVTEGDPAAQAHDVEVAPADPRRGHLDEDTVADGVGDLHRLDAAVGRTDTDHDGRAGPSTPSARSSAIVDSA